MQVVDKFHVFGEKLGQAVAPVVALADGVSAGVSTAGGGIGSIGDGAGGTGTSVGVTVAPDSFTDDSVDTSTGLDSRNRKFHGSCSN